MKPTTLCFVRVKDTGERHKLTIWLKGIGYTDKNISYERHGKYTDILIGNFWVKDTFNAIDCGTNIKLFKALAAMNDESDRE